MKTIHIFILLFVFSSLAYAQKDLSNDFSTRFGLNVDVTSSYSNERIWHSMDQRTFRDNSTLMLNEASANFISLSDCSKNGLTNEFDLWDWNAFSEYCLADGDWKVAVTEIFNQMWDSELLGEVYETDFKSSKWSKAGPSFLHNEYGVTNNHVNGTELSQQDEGVISLEPIGNLYVSDQNSAKWSKVENVSSVANPLTFPGGSELELVEKNGVFYEVIIR